MFFDTPNKWPLKLSRKICPKLKAVGSDPIHDCITVRTWPEETSTRNPDSENVDIIKKIKNRKKNKETQGTLFFSVS